MKIGEVARRAGVRVDTVRYYERRGLLPLSARRSSGYRVFAQTAVERIRFVKDAQAFGLTLNEVSEILRLIDGGGPLCVPARAHVRGALERLESKIAELTQMRDHLSGLLASCEVGRCKIAHEFAPRIRGKNPKRRISRSSGQ